MKLTPERWELLAVLVMAIGLLIYAIAIYGATQENGAVAPEPEPVAGAFAPIEPEPEPEPESEE